MSQQTKRLTWLAFFGLALGANGVVFGDIGTSVLYAVNAIFFGDHTHLAVNQENVLGVISIVVWTLTFKITGVYNLILRADHHGEGGMTALLAKLKTKTGASVAMLSIALVFAAGLLFGDGIITAALSILSALEGVVVANPSFKPYVLPAGLVIVTVLYYFQHKGTEKIGFLFGPIMTLHFIIVAALGVAAVAGSPQILWAFWPGHAVRFLLTNDFHTILQVMGSVMLVITGGEALYADLGHFGRGPIRCSWLSMVYWCLMLNYLGQGAYLLSGAEVKEGNIFYSMVPAIHIFGVPLLVYAMVVLETMATVIASQALITGMFSLTSAAISLGLFPRLKVVHTSGEHSGQIYVPAVNWAMYIGTIILMLVFQKSTALEAAYGLAVALVMLITSLTMIKISTSEWQWHPALAFGVFGLSAVIDVGFIVANSLKFQHGGYVPITIGFLLFFTMMTWRWGRTQIADALGRFNGKCIDWYIQLRIMLNDRQEALSEGFEYAAQLVSGPRRLVEMDRAVVFLTSRAIHGLEDKVPVVTRMFLKKYGAMPCHTTFLHVLLEDTATVPENERFRVIHLGPNVYSVIVRYGFMEEPNVRKALAELQQQGAFVIPSDRWIIETGEEALLIDADVPWFNRFRLNVLKFILKIAAPAHAYFGLAMDSGVSKELIPVRISKDGARVEAPELETSVFHNTVASTTA